MEKELNFAVLIDAENFSSKYIEKLFDVIAEYGYATIRRMYGDISGKQMVAWKDVAKTYSIKANLEHCYSSKKNSSDCALVIDAMDILHSGKVDGVWLVSSDGDFRNLAIRIREEGMTIYGAGETKTPKGFVNSCEKFIYLNTTTQDADTTIKEPERHTEVVKDGPTPIEDVMRCVIRFLENKKLKCDRQTMPLSSIGFYLCKKFPEFDCTNYGYKGLQQMFAHYEEFEIQEVPSRHDEKVKVIFIALKA